MAVNFFPIPTIKFVSWGVIIAKLQRFCHVQNIAFLWYQSSLNYANLESVGNPAVDTPQMHQYFPRSHHTQYPTYCSCRSLLGLHLQHYLLPVVFDRLHMELHVKNLIVKIMWLPSVPNHSFAKHTFTTHTSISWVEAVVWQNGSARAF